MGHRCHHTSQSSGAAADPNNTATKMAVRCQGPKPLFRGEPREDSSGAERALTSWYSACGVTPNTEARAIDIRRVSGLIEAPITTHPIKVGPTSSAACCRRRRDIFSPMTHELS